MSVQKWEAENPVPNEDFLYVRVHEQKIIKEGEHKGLPNTGAFYNTPKNGTDLSSDWSRYSTPKDARNIIAKEYKTGQTVFKNPNAFYILSFSVGQIREMENKGIPLDQRVIHTPRQENFPVELPGFPWNQAHCSIEGSDVERRIKMFEIAKWEIAPPEYNHENDHRNSQ